METEGAGDGLVESEEDGPEVRALKQCMRGRRNKKSPYTLNLK